MTIQISVVIWTVLCFLLLMLILNSLLFRPVLELLDRRKARIQDAAGRKAEQERRAAEYEARRQEAQAAALLQRQKEMKAEIERIRTESRAQLEAANEERLRKVDQYRLKVEAESAELLTMLTANAGELAVSFAESLTKD